MKSESDPLTTDECGICGQPMTLVDLPTERSFVVGAWELIVRRWSRIPYCVDCATADHDANEQAIYDDAAAHGYEQGWRVAQRQEQ